MEILSKISGFLRIEEWITSKITMMIGVFMYILFLDDVSVEEIYKKIIIYFLFVFFFLAISYIVNDLSDIEADKKAGKKKVIATIPLWWVWVILVLMFLAGNIPCIIFSGNRLICTALILIIYFFGISYSIPGIRFKERGIFGLIECSVAQRCLPLLVICCLTKLTKLQIIVLGGWFVISFLDGFRYILIHQVIDRENDLKSGIHTYASSKAKNYENIIKVVFYLELFLLIIEMIPVILRCPVACAAFGVVYVFMEFCIYKVLNVYAKKNWLLTFDSVPLEAFLNMVMPFLMGICLLNISPWMILYCLAIAAICFKPMLVKIRIAKVYLDSLRR